MVLRPIIWLISLVEAHHFEIHCARLHQQLLEVRKGRYASAEVVQRKAAATRRQGFDQGDRLLHGGDGAVLGDFEAQLAGWHLGSVDQLGGEAVEGRVGQRTERQFD